MHKKMNLFLGSLLCISLCFHAHNKTEDTNQPTPVQDYSLICHGAVDRIEYPKNIAELKNIVINADKPIAIAGGKYSMGGQIWCQGGIMIDMKYLNAITAFDPEEKIITVQAGACWRDLQEFLHKYKLSIKIMQSYNDFSVGGSLSVNVHGRDPHGQIIEAVESITVMLADGSLTKISKTDNSDLFKGFIGGYGACGVIVTATLRLEDNYKIKRVLTSMPVTEFRKFYIDTIAHDHNITLFNANLYGPDFKEIVSFAWYKTDEPLTISNLAHTHKDQVPLIPAYLEHFVEYAVSNFYMAQKLRLLLDSQMLQYKNHVVWRSYEMSESVNFLAPSTTKVSKILQEYFVPVDQFDTFVNSVRTIALQHQIKILNLSIRHVPKNNGSILSYAPQDSFAFVFYIATDNNENGHEHISTWTNELIDAALKIGGTYYLPYHILASPDQFKQAYPRYLEFVACKQKYDPLNKFQNSLSCAYQEHCMQ